MAYVITGACVGVKDGACLTQCPVDAIHPTRDDPQFTVATQLYIDPDECIHCNLCADACPVGAIFPDDDMPAGTEHYVKINADWFRR